MDTVREKQNVCLCAPFARFPLRTHKESSGGGRPQAVQYLKVQVDELQTMQDYCSKVGTGYSVDVSGCEFYLCEIVFNILPASLALAREQLDYLMQMCSSGLDIWSKVCEFKSKKDAERRKQLEHAESVARRTAAGEICASIEIGQHHELVSAVERLVQTQNSEAALVFGEFTLLPGSLISIVRLYCCRLDIYGDVEELKRNQTEIDYDWLAWRRKPWLRKQQLLELASRYLNLATREKQLDASSAAARETLKDIENLQPGNCMCTDDYRGNGIYYCDSNSILWETTGEYGYYVDSRAFEMIRRFGVDYLGECGLGFEYCLLPVGCVFRSHGDGERDAFVSNGKTAIALRGAGEWVCVDSVKYEASIVAFD